MFYLKRIYEPWNADRSYRILVDRVWPRGISKENAHVDLWMREIAPSTELRKWFGHDVEKWPEFQEKYREELDTKKGLLNDLRSLERRYKKVTLLYGAKDRDHNHAVVLLQELH